MIWFYETDSIEFRPDYNWFKYMTRTSPYAMWNPGKRFYKYYTIRAVPGKLWIIFGLLSFDDLGEGNFQIKTRFNKKRNLVFHSLPEHNKTVSGIKEFSESAEVKISEGGNFGVRTLGVFYPDGKGYRIICGVPIAKIFLSERILRGLDAKPL